MDGHQRANSETQLGSVESGPTTMKGPCTPLERKCDKNPIVCTCVRKQRPRFRGLALDEVGQRRLFPLNLSVSPCHPFLQAWYSGGTLQQAAL